MANMHAVGAAVMKLSITTGLTLLNADRGGRCVFARRMAECHAGFADTCCAWWTQRTLCKAASHTGRL